MSLALIIIIIALGLAFLFIEVFLIPGTAFVGVLGVVLMIAGIIATYNQYNATYGHIVLAFSLVTFFAMLIVGFKRISQLKWADKENIDSKVNVLEEDIVSIGEKGTAFSDLRPNGKAIFANHRVEVFSTGDFIKKNQPIEVTKITSSKIFVKPIKES